MPRRGTEYRETVATVASQIAEAFTKAWSSAMAVQTLARDLRPVLHRHPDDQQTVVTIDLDRLNLEPDDESAST
jgi:hypothetical protein